MSTTQILNAHENEFMTRILEKHSYDIEVPGESEIVHDIEKYVLPDLLNQSCFARVLLPLRQQKLTKIFEDFGFRFIDTNMYYEKLAGDPYRGLNRVRWVEESDAEALIDLAYNSFSFTPYYYDTEIDEDTAREIVSGWVESYFTGERGDCMAVAEIDGELQGYIQIRDPDALQMVIDLVVVSRQVRGQGLAREMISFVESESPDKMVIKINTLLSNEPSIRLYESLGFRMAKADYIFHYHS